MTFFGGRRDRAAHLDRVTPQHSEKPVEIILLDDRQTVIGRLRFRACPKCRTGRILDVWISDDWQRQGLGREALDSLITLRPGHRWNTTMQSRQGRAFFKAMAREMGEEFSPGGPLCPHLRARPSWFTRHVLGRWLARWRRKSSCRRR